MKLVMYLPQSAWDQSRRSRCRCTYQSFSHERRRRAPTVIRRSRLGSVSWRIRPYVSWPGSHHLFYTASSYEDPQWTARRPPAERPLVTGRKRGQRHIRVLVGALFFENCTRSTLGGDAMHHELRHSSWPGGQERTWGETGSIRRGGRPNVPHC